MFLPLVNSVDCYCLPITYEGKELLNKIHKPKRKTSYELGKNLFFR